MFLLQSMLPFATPGVLLLQYPADMLLFTIIATDPFHITIEHSVDNNVDRKAAVSVTAGENLPFYLLLL